MPMWPVGSLDTPDSVCNPDTRIDIMFRDACYVIQNFFPIL